MAGIQQLAGLATYQACSNQRSPVLRVSSPHLLRLYSTRPQVSDFLSSCGKTSHCCLLMPITCRQLYHISKAAPRFYAYPRPVRRGRSAVLCCISPPRMTGQAAKRDQTGFSGRANSHQLPNFSLTSHLDNAQIISETLHNDDTDVRHPHKAIRYLPVIICRSFGLTHQLEGPRSLWLPQTSATQYQTSSSLST